MKRLAAFMLALMLLVSSAVCETAVQQKNNYLTCQCGYSICQCFAQSGDEGYLIKASSEMLVKLGFLDRVSNTFDAAVFSALEAFQASRGITLTGTLDDETLVKLFGTDTSLNVYYVPVKGGKKLHSDPDCGIMENPRVISGDVALWLVNQGYTSPCKHCMDGYNPVP